MPEEVKGPLRPPLTPSATPSVRTEPEADLTPTAAAGSIFHKIPKDRMPQLPSEARKQILATARELSKRYAPVFEQNPSLRRVAATLFLTGIRPRRRSGRPCDPAITRASSLLRKYRSEHPGETPAEIWERIYSVVIPGFAALPARARSKVARNLRAAVRSRRNSRRRRHRAKQ